jgi:hypothetical protein
MNAEQGGEAKQSTAPKSVPVQERSTPSISTAEPPPAPHATRRVEEVENRMTTFEKITVRWARFAVVVSLLGGVVVWYQWREMNKQTAAVQGQLTLARQQFEEDERLGSLSNLVGMAE